MNYSWSPAFPFQLKKKSSAEPFHEHTYTNASQLKRWGESILDLVECLLIDQLSALILLMLSDTSLSLTSLQSVHEGGVRKLLLLSE